MNVQPNPFLKTKIVCTIGPASQDAETLRALCDAGMNVARLNMAHGDPEELRRAAKLIRDCAADRSRPVALLADLQGPKLRVGELPDPLQVSVGDQLVLLGGDSPRPGEVPVTYSHLADDLSIGDRVLIDDGQIELQVNRIEPPRVHAVVVIPGTVEAGKGINLPAVHVSAPPLTQKDLSDLELALDIGVDYLGQSFVRRSTDIRELRSRVPDDVLIIAKIEKDVALQDLDAILEASDAVMVARGDLGTELPFEQVPLAQKRIVRMANSRYRPVIIATQMLETMISHPRPTRAEVSDVANALLDGTDAVMLAAETATGEYPIDSVRALTRVIREIESSAVMVGGPAYDVPPTPREGGPVPTELAVAGATAEAVRVLRAPAVVTFTRSGYTARVVSSRRPPVPILAVTDQERVLRQLALVWGVVPVLCEEDPSYDNMWYTAREELLRREMAGGGDRVVVTAGVPFHVRGTTNMVRIEVV